MNAVGDRLIVKLDSWENRTESGLFLTKYDETTPVDGEVVAVGSQVKEQIKVGDRVNCVRYQGTIFWHPNNKEQKFLSIKECDIVGVWE